MSETLICLCGIFVVFAALVLHSLFSTEKPKDKGAEYEVAKEPDLTKYHFQKLHKNKKV